MRSLQLEHAFIRNCLGQVAIDERWIKYKERNLFTELSVLIQQERQREIEQRIHNKPYACYKSQDAN